MTLLVLQAATITLVFVRGSIFEWIRGFWPGFFGCPLCVGVWVGLGLSCAHHFPQSAQEGLSALGIGALTGVLALGAHLILDVLGALADLLER